jgi:hypothetical protein
MSARALLSAAVCFAVLTATACDTVPIGTDGTDGGVATPAASAVCTANSDCALQADFCVAPCGACRPITAADPVSRCLPPPPVSCQNPCRNARAVCLLGHCAVQ